MENKIHWISKSIWFMEIKLNKIKQVFMNYVNYLNFCFAFMLFSQKSNMMWEIQNNLFFNIVNL